MQAVQPTNSKIAPFDKSTGNFIVKIRMSSKDYARFAQEEIIADMDSLVFDSQMKQFIVPVYMSPEEYSKYAQDNTLPNR